MRPISLSDEHLSHLDQEDIDDFEHSTSRSDGIRNRKGELFLDSLFDQQPDEDEDEDVLQADFVEDYEDDQE